MTAKLSANRMRKKSASKLTDGRRNKMLRPKAGKNGILKKRG